MKKKTTAVAKVDQKKKAVWSGANVFMEKAHPGSSEEKQQRLIKMTAEVLNISPFGVNILGSVPYINKLGLAEKVEQYGKGKDKFVYEWVNVAMNDTDKAICKCRITNADKPLSDWIIGECSPVTMKMKTLNGYQNHMAQTRSKNRAILELYGVRIHEEMMENIYKRIQDKRMTEEQGSAFAAVAGRAATSSAEEVQDDKTKNTGIPNQVFIGPKAAAPGVTYHPTKDAEEYRCKECGREISEAEAAYSMRIFKKPLCREHQPKKK